MIKDKFFVDETMHGTRLDIAITKYLGRKYSRNQIKNFILVDAYRSMTRIVSLKIS